MSGQSAFPERLFHAARARSSSTSAAPLASTSTAGLDILLIAKPFWRPDGRVLRILAQRFGTGLFRITGLRKRAI